MNFDKKYYKRLALIPVALILFVLAGYYFSSQAESSNIDLNYQAAEEEKKEVITERIQLVKIEAGSTFGVLMNEAGLSTALANELYNVAYNTYNLAAVREGREIRLVYDLASDKLKSLLYQIDSEEELFISRDVLIDESGEISLGVWQAERRLIPYEVKVVSDEAVIENNLYQSAIDAGIDERAIIDLANAFQWTLDFAMDTKNGDSFKFIYEKRFLHDEYVMPGQILAAKYTNQGKDYYVFYFEESEDNKGYFDLDGNSVQKMFLKAPLEFKYISSGFTTGLRYIKAFNVSTGHRAIDYAAAMGTPIRAVGDGTIVMAKWNGAYGNMISLKHNATYTTNYAHLSKFAVRYGAKVEQGDIIGYVGSTGFSTGPHLHYEMVKNGVKINPLLEVLPPGKAILDENKDRFYQEIGAHRESLDK